MSRNRKARRAETKRKKRIQKQLIGGIAAITVLLVAAFLGFSRRGASTPSEAIDEEALAALPEAPEIGARAPNFTLENITGQQVALSDFRGTPVAVMFFHTW